MRRILKWTFPATGSDLLVPWSVADEVLLVAAEWSGLQADTTIPAPPPLVPSLWTLTDCRPDGTAVRNYGDRTFALIGTGASPPATWPHAGSAVCGRAVWHVYGEPVELPPGVRRV